MSTATHPIEPASTAHGGCRGASSKGVTTRINLHVAARLRAAHLLAGISQEKVGEIVGVTFQQIQKYENGTTRVTIGNLAVLAEAFGVPVEWFLEGAPAAGIGAAAVSSRAPATELLSTRLGAELARNFLAIHSQTDRSVVAQVAKSIAAKGGAT